MLDQVEAGQRTGLVVTLYSSGRRWWDAVADRIRSLAGVDGGMRYELDADDIDALRGQGTLYHGPDRVVNARRCIAGTERPLYAVGDVAAESLIDAGAAPALVVTDGRTRRTRYDTDLDLDRYTEYAAENPAGCITEEAYDAVRDALDDASAHIRVEGEEDLLGLAVVDHAEAGTLVYGDPGIDGPAGIRAVGVGDVGDAVRTLLDDIGPC